MKNELTREQIEEALREALANPKIATPQEVVEFLVGFSAAHYAYSGQSLQDWLLLCQNCYLRSREEGIARGLIDAPN